MPFSRGWRDEIKVEGQNNSFSTSFLSNYQPTDWREFKFLSIGQCLLHASFADLIFAFSSSNLMFPKASYHGMPQSMKLSQAQSHLWNQRHRPTLNAAWVPNPNFWSAVCSLFPSLLGSWSSWHFSLVSCPTLDIEQKFSFPNTEARFQNWGYCTM